MSLVMVGPNDEKVEESFESNPCQWRRMDYRCGRQSWAVIATSKGALYFICKDCFLKSKGCVVIAYRTDIEI